MIAMFAFCAGLYYDLPLGYFILGFIILMLGFIILMLDDGLHNY